MKTKLGDLIEEYSERNVDNKYKPVAVGKYGIRARESIYTKELAKDYSKNKLIYKGTLTVGMGSNQIDIGILRDDEIYSVSPAYHTYKIKIPNYDYLDYLLAANNNRMFSIYANRGSRQGKTLDLKRWLTDELCLHDEKDQKIIVHTLNTVKQLINQKEAELVKLDNLIKARFVEMFDDNFGEIVELGNVCDVRDGTHDSPKYHNEGYPLVTSKNICDGKIDFSTCNLIQKEDYAKINKRSKVDVGDVLMPMIGTVGNPIIVNTDKEFAIKNVALIKFKDDSVILNTFIKTLLESDYFGRAVLSKTKGGTQKFISLGDIRKLEFNLPPIELQHRFATFVAQVDKSKFALVKSIKLLKKSPFDIFLGLL